MVPAINWAAFGLCAVCVVGFRNTNPRWLTIMAAVLGLLNLAIAIAWHLK